MKALFFNKDLLIEKRIVAKEFFINEIFSLPIFYETIPSKEDIKEWKEIEELVTPYKTDYIVTNIINETVFLRKM